MVVKIDRIPNMPTRVRRALEGIGSEFVPYTGAIKDTDLGAFDITAAEVTATTYASAYSIATFVVLHAGGGTGNTCVGIYAGLGLTTGTWNTCVGWSAGKALTVGVGNICIGSGAGILMTVADYNILIGKDAGASLVGDDDQVTIGDNNVFMGHSAGTVAVKSYNTAIGSFACQYMTDGSKNTFIGHLSGGDGAAGALTVGIENTYIGANSGRYNIGNDRCTGIGYYTGATSGASDDLQGSVAIGAFAAFSASNQLVIGGAGANYRITDVYIGDGVVVASPQDVTINPTGGSGTDTEAKDLILAGGKSTGDAAPGDILFKTSTAGASGTTLQSLTTRLTLTGVIADFSGLNLTTTGSYTAGTLTVADGTISDSDGTIAIGTGAGADVLNLITNKVYITRGDLALQGATAEFTAPIISGIAIVAVTSVTTPNFTAATNSNLTIVNYASNYDIVFSFNDGGVTKTFTIDASENTLDLDTGHLLTTGTGSFKNIGIETTTTPVDTKTNMYMSSNTLRFEGYDASTGGQIIGFEIDFDNSVSEGPTLRGTTTKDANKRIYIDGSIIFSDNQFMTFGTGSRFQMSWDSTNNDYMMFKTNVGNALYSGNLVFADRANLPSEDYPIVSHPTFRIQSSSGTFADYIQFYHDGTDGRIESGSDTINFGDDTLTTTGGVVAGASIFGDGGTTNYVSASATGDVVFHGSGGLIFAEIYAHAVAADITSVAQNDWDQITAFDTDGENNGATPDHTNDHITIVTAGKYLASFHWCGHGPAAAHDWAFHLAKNNGTTVFNSLQAHVTSPTTQKDTSISCTGILDLAADDTIELWVKRTSAGNNIVLTTDNCGITLTQIGGT